ncbi:sterol homeostasis protein [Orbilia oligospora]|uniref:Protein ARV n=1 Tax=Orbilia oligospora TaxID=2813651 RepID=A0A7C8JTS4_ORBOL|nr:sterol homeostasis protein [Orbilia oligospora]
MGKVCIECKYPVPVLYTTSQAAYDRKTGSPVRLTQCPRCKHFADKYVEHDFVVLFIDMVLIKPQVYRHLLFNRLQVAEDDKPDRSIIRLGVLLLLFDVYLTWARIEKQAPTPSTTSTLGILNQQPIVIQYIFFLLLCLTETIIFHSTIRFISFYYYGFTKPNAVSTALLVSSSAAKSVGWAVVVNNLEALRILLDVSYPKAALLAFSGALVRSLSTNMILYWTGLPMSGWGFEGWV